MKTVKKVETVVDKFWFGFYDLEKEEFIPIDVRWQADMDLAVAKFNCPEVFIDAIGIAFESLAEAIVSDLADIWKRLDEAGI